MGGIDIRGLVDFLPPRYLCQQCRCIITNRLLEFAGGAKNECPVCRVRYVYEDGFISVDDYLKEHSAIATHDLLSHMSNLARIANRFDEDNHAHINALLAAFEQARDFIHFTTTGMSLLFIGALKVAAQHVDVRGIVSAADERIISEVQEFRSDAPQLHVLTRGEDESCAEAPHTGLIVIDGLMAFRGSANLTTNAWRKAEAGKEHIGVVTKVEDVKGLNNRYFSPLWAELHGAEDEIIMHEVVAF